MREGVRGWVSPKDVDEGDTDMNDTDQQQPHDSEQQLEEQLASATRWEGETPELWKKALDAAGDDTKGATWWASMTKQRRFSGLAAAIVIMAAVGLVAAMLLPGSEIVTVSLSSAAPSPAQIDVGKDYPRTFSESPPAPLSGTGGAAKWASDGDGLFYSSGMPGRRSRANGGGEPGLITLSPDDTSANGDRHVARKAHMELIAEDVRSVFLRAAQLVSEARGEFVEESSLTGADEKARASLTLRVDAGRLSEVLNELRTLGVVHAEDSRGDDVTTQVVDLESRLRNERRVETELLELLDTRDDAPLREVLDLRQHLSQVRAIIERLTAQQQRLSRLVSLASVLVIIRPTDAPIEEEPSLGGYFIESVGDSWTSGLQFLSDTIAGLLRVVIGGAIWWILVIAAVVLIHRARRQKSDVAAA